MSQPVEPDWLKHIDFNHFESYRQGSKSFRQACREGSIAVSQRSEIGMVSRAPGNAVVPSFVDNTNGTAKVSVNATSAPLQTSGAFGNEHRGRIETASQRNIESVRPRPAVMSSRSKLAPSHYTASPIPQHRMERPVLETNALENMVRWRLARDGKPVKPPARPAFSRPPTITPNNSTSIPPQHTTNGEMSMQSATLLEMEGRRRAVLSLQQHGVLLHQPAYEPAHLIAQQRACFSLQQAGMLPFRSQAGPAVSLAQQRMPYQSSSTKRKAREEKATPTRPPAQKRRRIEDDREIEEVTNPSIEVLRLVEDSESVEARLFRGLKRWKKQEEDKLRMLPRPRTKGNIRVPLGYEPAVCQVTKDADRFAEGYEKWCIRIKKGC